MGKGHSMKKHSLKTWLNPFAAQLKGLKNYEVRINDRDFAVGDFLILREWDEFTEQFTGEELIREVTYMTYGGAFGMPKGLCIMSTREP